jgi:hypothetical protein
MSDLDLLAPAIAIVALFGVVGLIVQSIRHGRAIRQLEERLREGGSLATEASLERIRQLQTRAEISSGQTRRTGPAVTIAALLAVAVVAGGAWYLFSGGDSDDAASADSAQQGETTAPAQTEPEQGSTTADDGSETVAGTSDAPSDAIPEEIPPLDNKAAVVVAIFNASGVPNAAGGTVSNLVQAQGYSIGTIGNSPDGRSDLGESVVMWPEGKQEIAWNVARDLGVSSAPKLDGLDAAQLGGADVAVIVGLDLANS